MPDDPVRRFESAFAASQGSAAARAFWMGRVALYALLRVLGIGSGDRVGICTYTCLGAVEPIKRLQATPVFLDVDRHMNIAPSSLERLREPLKALIVQHTFGVPCDLDAFLTWTRAHNVPLIEDCCHSLDSTWNGRKVGTFGIGAIFGFEWGKPFSTGQGGLLTLNDGVLAREVDRLIRAEAVMPSRVETGVLAIQRPVHRCLVHPRTRRRLRSLYRWAGHRGWITTSDAQTPQQIGPSADFLKLFSRSQARAALQELQRWPENRRRRETAARAIRERLQSEHIGFLEPDARAAPVYLRVPIWVEHKERLLAAAESELVDVAGWYSSPAHPLRGPVLTEWGYDPAECPTAEQAFARVVTLPTRPALRPGQLDAAVRLIRQSL